MRKSNVSGSIYKMKGKRRKPWVVRITLGYSLDGKQLRKVIGTYTTKNEEDTYFLKGTTTEQLSYSTFKPRFKKLLKELKIGTHTIHDTRHTFATRLNNADANQTSIIRLIGHSNFSTTENVYTHKNTEELRKAIELLK